MKKNIGIITTSKAIQKNIYEKVDFGISELQKIGLITIKSDNFYEFFFGSGGDGKTRAENIKKILKNELKGIICSDGGDTTNEILRFLDFKFIKKKNVPIIGFSDNTVLINAISKINKTKNFLGPDLVWGFGEKKNNFTKKEFKEILLENRNFSNLLEGKLIKKGKIYKGKIWGGNIRCFLKLLGTKYFPELKGSILLIEEVNQNSLWFNSILEQLIYLGIIEKLNGIIIGKCHNIDFFGEKSLDDLFLRKLKDFDNLFIYKTNSFGHKTEFSLFPIGSEAKLDIINKRLIYE